MAALFEAGRLSPEPDDLSASPHSVREPDDVLAPIIAGAFARGMAESFNLLDIPAFFFDRDGRVLFASTAAQRYLVTDFTLRAGHLLAQDHADNGALARFMTAVLQDPRTPRALRLESGVTLSALPMPTGLSPSDQLLHAVIRIG
jgi:hypothetical protein